MQSNQPRVSIIILGEHHGETVIYKTLEKELPQYAQNYKIKFLGEANIESINNNIEAKEKDFPKNFQCFSELERIYAKEGRTALMNKTPNLLQKNFTW